MRAPIHLVVCQNGHPTCSNLVLALFTQREAQLEAVKQCFNTYEIMVYFFLSACPTHCILCYNASTCYECTSGYYLNELEDCVSK